MAYQVITPAGEILADNAVLAERVDAQGEKGLIKVTVDTDGGFYYIGHGALNDTYSIKEVPDQELGDTSGQPQ